MIKGTITGLDETLKHLKALPGKVQRKILRPAMSKASTLIMREAKRRAVRDSGLLAKSIKRKVQTYKNGGTLHCVIGPAMNQGRTVKRFVKTFNSFWDRWANPDNYAHLVEFGTRPHRLARRDKLARSGPNEQLRMVRAVVRFRRWMDEIKSIDPETASHKQFKRREKLIARVYRHRQKAIERVGERQTATAAMHPGTKPRPFLRPAYDATKGDVEKIFAKEVAAGIDKHAKR